MIQLPYREHESISGGGEMPNSTNYMEVQEPGRIQPEGTVTTDTGTYTTFMKQKRNSKSYKTELKAMTKERNRWRWTCFGLVVSYVIGLLISLFLN